MEVNMHDAKMSTLTVTLQTICVNNKQMTLAVFKQLPDACVYHRDGRIKPQLHLWGVVRYSINLGYIGVTMWVVCSIDGRLYRCPLLLRENIQRIDNQEQAALSERYLLELPQLFIAV